MLLRTSLDSTRMLSAGVYAINQAPTDGCRELRARGCGMFCCAACARDVQAARALLRAGPFRYTCDGTTYVGTGAAPPSAARGASSADVP